MVRRIYLLLCAGGLWFVSADITRSHDALAAGGSLTVSVRDEADDKPVITRMVIQRSDAPGRRVAVSKHAGTWELSSVTRYPISFTTCN